MSQVITAALLQARRGETATQVLCHDRYGYLESSDFGRRACTLCYVYLFPSQWPDYIAVVPHYIYLVPVNGIHSINNGTLYNTDEAGSLDYNSNTDSATLLNNQAGMQVTDHTHSQTTNFVVENWFLSQIGLR